jgi:PAS domain S-box-containing protein
MPGSVEQKQILYELALAIGPHVELTQLLEQVLSTFIEKLNCSAGALFFWQNDPNQVKVLKPIYWLPNDSFDRKLFAVAMGRFPSLTAAGPSEMARLPLVEPGQAESWHHILELPNLGLLVLCKSGSAIPDSLLKALPPLLVRLASACTVCSQYQILHKAHRQAITLNHKLSQKSVELRASHIELSTMLQELRLVTARNQAILAAIPDILLYIDRDGYILDRKVADEPGSAAFPPAINSADRITEIVPPDRVASTLVAIGKTLDTGQMQIFEYKALSDRKGQYIEIRLVKSDPYEVLAIIRNISRRKRVEEALKAAQERLRAILRHVPIVIFALDQHGVYTLSEGKGLEVLGRKPDQVVGQSIFDVYHDKPEILINVQRALAGESTTLTTEINGTLFDAQYEPLRDSDNEVVGVVGVAYDITERTEGTQRLSAVLDTVGEGIMTIDPGGVIVMVNQEIRNIWGYGPAELIGDSVGALLSDDYREPFIAGLTQYLATGSGYAVGQRLELEGLRKNGQIFPLEIYVSETKIGERLWFTVAVRDITERHELDMMRNEFVSTVSHELRTPLASIMGFIETVLTGRPGPLTDTQQRFLQNSYGSAERLLKLIEELLTVSRIQQGTLKLHKQLFSPWQALTNTRNVVMSLANAQLINLQVQDDWPQTSQIHGDQDRLEQVMINLVGNAIKFSREAGWVKVASGPKDGMWLFEVTDKGIGIPPDELPRLFDRFYRASNAAAEQIQGTGLGLYVCRAIIEDHGGQIGLESELNHGTRAWFTLPLEDSEPTALASPSVRLASLGVVIS